MGKAGLLYSVFSKGGSFTHSSYLFCPISFFLLETILFWDRRDFILTYFVPYTHLFCTSSLFVFQQDGINLDSDPQGHWGRRWPDPRKGPDTDHLYLRAQSASEAPDKIAGLCHQTEHRKVGPAGSDTWVSGHIIVGSGCSRPWMQDLGLGMESQAELECGQGGVSYRTGSQWGTACSGQQFFFFLAQKQEQQHICSF